MGKIYQQLSLAERTMIQTQLKIGIKSAVIPLGLGRSPSTISRELYRNGWKGRRCAVAGDVLRSQAATAPKWLVNAPMLVR